MLHESSKEGHARVVALDFGSKTVGVAVSDPLLFTATGIEVIRRERENKLRTTLARIGEILSEYHAGKIVLGLPLMPSGDEGERAGKTREFAEMLKTRFNIPVVLQDERLSTVEAEEIMAHMGIRKKDYWYYVDMVAAKVILEDYLHETDNI